MNQINYPSSDQVTLEPVSKPEPGRVTPAKVMPQARRDFDAALRRAGQHETGDEDALPSDQPDPLRSGLAALAAFAPMLPPGALAAQVASADAALGSSAMTARPSINHGTPPDAAPATAGALSANAAGTASQQWQLNIPPHDAASSALAVRLVSAGTGHWQVRLAADGPTRAQLTPSLGRLRDKLRQHSDDRIDDLGFDDDIGPEPDAQV